MPYIRPAYNDPSVPLREATAFYLPAPIRIPKFETPVTPLENLRLAARRREPYWLPNALADFQTLMTQDVVYKRPGDRQLHADFRDPRNYTENYTFREWFNSDWTWVVSAGGAMLTPGTQVCGDITQWERQIPFPSLADWDFETPAADFRRDTHDPERVTHFDIGRGVTERLVSVMGGYTEAMLAMAMEPEATRAFFDRYADFVIEFFDKIHGLYDLNMLTLHDDWGTERDTFFSEKMMEELVFEPTKRIIDHVKALGVVFELHSCGNITRFVPYMCQMGADLLQIQRRAVDIPKLKAQYGDKIGFNVSVEGLEAGQPMETQKRLIRESVDLYGKHGGAYTSVYAADPAELWETMAELYYYSREYYDAAYGR